MAYRLNIGWTLIRVGVFLLGGCKVERQHIPEYESGIQRLRIKFHLFPKNTHQITCHRLLVMNQMQRTNNRYLKNRTNIMFF